MALTLTDNRIGALVFTLYVDGVEVDTLNPDDALEYLHGADNIVPGLEAALAGKQAGDKFDVTVSPEDAYGEYDEENTLEVDLAEFDETGAEPAVGLEVELLDSLGELYEGTIIQIRGDVAVVDLNHELAGKTIRYVGEVATVREATEQELEWGLPESLLDELFDEDEFDLAFDDEE